MNECEYRKLYELGDTHFWFVGRKKIIKMLIDRFILSKKIRILDAGCGTGNMIKFLQDYGAVCGIDSSRIALEFCQKQGLSLICQGSVTDLPFKGCQFDLITSFDVLSHISVTNEHKVLSEFYRVIKPGGYLLFADVACNLIKSIHDVVAETRERYYRNKIKQLFLENNFRITKISYMNFFLFPVVFCVRVFRRLFGRYKIDSQLDLKPASPLLNKFFIYIFKIEAALLQRLCFPIGSSIICLAKKIE